ncbi:MAG: heme o synthase [Conexivisphaerales archaeon]
MSLRSYWELTNPNIVSLLVFTAFTSAIMAGGIKEPLKLLDVTAAVALCSMGARTLTNYVDRDIDALMNRTKHRPLPSGALSPLSALAYGFGLSTLGLAIAVPLGFLYPTLLALGMVDNIVIYNVLTKRRTPWNIILGAPSGGFPAFVGYLSISKAISLTPFFLAAIVVLWTPIHIWSLAIRCREDYNRASIPMLPVVLGVKKGIRCIASTSILLALFTILFPFLPGSPFGELTLFTSLALSVPLLLISFKLVKSPTEKTSWTLFKFTSPYLAILFTMMALDVALFH